MGLRSFTYPLVVLALFGSTQAFAAKKKTVEIYSATETETSEVDLFQGDTHLEDSDSAFLKKQAEEKLASAPKAQSSNDPIAARVQEIEDQVARIRSQLDAEKKVAVSVSASPANRADTSLAQAQPKKPLERFDPVPEVHRDSIIKRLILIERLIRDYGRAYDYRVHTSQELESILSQLEAASTPKISGT